MNYAGIYRQSLLHLKGKELTVFLHILINCNHKDNPNFVFNNKPLPLKRGEWVTSIPKLKELTGYTDQQIRTSLKNLTNLTYLLTDNLTNRGRLLTVVNIDNFLVGSDGLTDQLTDQLTDHQQTDNRPITINKNDNNNNNDKNEYISLPKGRVSELDYEQVLDLYNQTAEKLDLPKAQKLTATRKKQINARMKDCGGIDGWKHALEKIADSEFLIGKNNRGWKASLDFLLQESSFTKLMEGSYDNKLNSQLERKTDDKLKQYFEKLDSGREEANIASFIFPS